MKDKISNYTYYFPSNPESLAWGLTVTTIGHQIAEPGGEYPVGNHPIGYAFNPDTGRVLNDFQLIYIAKGSGFFESSSVSRREVRAGTLIFLFPEEWHNYKPDAKTGWEEYWVGCRGTILAGLCENGFFRKETPVSYVGSDPELVKLFENALKTTKTQALGFQFKLAGIVANMLGHCNYLERVKSVRNNEIAANLNLAKELILKDVNLKPEDLAEKIGMGYTWFRRAFKEYTGLSPAQYISDIKFQQSIWLLNETDKSIPEISQVLGFDSDYYFSAFFKKRQGKTPVKFRNLEREKRQNNKTSNLQP